MSRVTQCRTCGARIVFLDTDSGKKMPVDADSVEPTDTKYVHGQHVSHFRTCTEPSRHRRRTR